MACWIRIEGQMGTRSSFISDRVASNPNAVHGQDGAARDLPPGAAKPHMASCGWCCPMQDTARAILYAEKRELPRHPKHLPLFLPCRLKFVDLLSGLNLSLQHLGNISGHSRSAYHRIPSKHIPKNSQDDHLQGLRRPQHLASDHDQPPLTPHPSGHHHRRRDDLGLVRSQGNRRYCL